MNVTAYISDLIYRHECVILPGFGAFLTQRQPAAIQYNTHTFSPPRKALSFNKQLQNNDGLLANYISAFEKCSYTDALAKIQRFVIHLNSEIDQGKRVHLEAIGTFFSSVENTLQFEPDTQINYLTESYGLGSFASPEIHRVVDRETYKKEIAALETKAPINFTPEKRNRRNRRPYLKYAAIVLMALGTGIFGLKQYSNVVIAHNNAVSLEVSAAIKKEVLEAGFVYESEDPLPVVAIRVPGAHLMEKQHLGKYHIVAGAFRVPENAIKKMMQLRTKGFKSRLLGENKYGLHQVAYESHSDKYEALRELRRIKRNEDYNAWLLVQDINEVQNP